MIGARQIGGNINAKELEARNHFHLVLIGACPPPCFRKSITSSFVFLSLSERLCPDTMLLSSVSDAAPQHYILSLCLC